MANEIFATETNLSSSEIAAQFALLLLADRAIIKNHPALIYGPAQAGSLVTRVPIVGLQGYDLATATAEAAEVVSTALTTSAAEVTLSRFSKAYNVSGLAGSIVNIGLNGLEILSPESFAADAVISHQMTLTSLVANLGDNFANTVGTTTVALSVASFLSAKMTLDVEKNEGAYMALLHTTAFAHLQSSVSTSTAGAIQWATDSQSLMQQKGMGPKGSFLGVDIYTTSQSPLMNSSADRGSCMFARGAVVWSDRAPIAQAGGTLLGNVLFEIERKARADQSHYVSHSYMGVAEAIDLAGVTIIAKATI